jgi:hypothetical protein
MNIGMLRVFDCINKCVINADNVLAKDVIIVSHSWKNSGFKNNIQNNKININCDINSYEGMNTKIHIIIKCSILIGFRYAWIDTICINQLDEQEKNQQIPLMGKFYSQSKAVLCLLGHTNLKYFHYVIDETYSKFNDRIIERNSINMLINHMFNELGDTGIINEQWFGRVWTLQEIVLPNRSYAVGKDYNIIDIRNCLLKLAEMIEYVYKNKLPPGLNDFSYLITTANIVLKGPTKRTALDILRAVSKRQCLISHDKIYGILGLFYDIEEKIIVNYQKPFYEIIREFLIEIGKSGDWTWLAHNNESFNINGMSCIPNIENSELIILNDASDMSMYACNGDIDMNKKGLFIKGQKLQVLNQITLFGTWDIRLRKVVKWIIDLINLHTGSKSEFKIKIFKQIFNLNTYSWSDNTILKALDYMEEGYLIQIKENKIIYFEEDNLGELSTDKLAFLKWCSQGLMLNSHEYVKIILTKRINNSMQIYDDIDMEMNDEKNDLRILAFPIKNRKEIVNCLIIIPTLTETRRQLIFACKKIKDNLFNKISSTIAVKIKTVTTSLNETYIIG